MACQLSSWAGPGTRPGLQEHALDVRLIHTAIIGTKVGRRPSTGFDPSPEGSIDKAQARDPSSACDPCTSNGDSSTCSKPAQWRSSVACSSGVRSTIAGSVTVLPGVAMPAPGAALAAPDTAGGLPLPRRWRGAVRTPLRAPVLAIGDDVAVALGGPRNHRIRRPTHRAVGRCALPTGAAPARDAGRRPGPPARIATCRQRTRSCNSRSPRLTATDAAARRAAASRPSGPPPRSWSSRPSRRRTRRQVRRHGPGSYVAFEAGARVAEPRPAGRRPRARHRRDRWLRRRRPSPASLRLPPGEQPVGADADRRAAPRPRFPISEGLGLIRQQRGSSLRLPP